MKIRRLTLENFGIYAHTNTLDFTGDTPVILIGGMNGRGKTTILEAVLLALYGRRSFAAEESKLAFPKYLTQWINTTDKSMTAKVTLEFEMPSENGSTVYTVIREWSLHTALPAFKTKVSKNGIFDPVLSQNWDLFIEEMLPSAIAPFFFFDGEKIAELAAADNNEQMKASIKTLLGIHVIDQAMVDVERILHSKQALIKSAAFEAELAEYEAALKSMDSNIQKSKAQSDALLAKLAKLEDTLHKAEKAFDAMGGHLALGRKDLQAKQAVLLERLEQATAKILEIAAGDLPLLMVLPLLQQALTASGREVAQRNTQAALAQLPALFLAYSQENEAALDFDDFLSYVQRTVTNDTPVYALTEAGQHRLQSLCTSLPDEKRAEAASALAVHKQLQAELATTENYLSLQVDDTEAGQRHNDILALTADIATAKEQLRVTQAAEGALLCDREEVWRKQQKLIEKTVNDMEGEDDNKRIIKYAGLTAQVLEAYKMRLQAAKTKKLAQTMTDCFRRLASKQNLIHDIHIDEASLDFSYVNDSGQAVSPASFSAGEKQLLVIAMLWALGICSKKQLPVIIDTPLARLDSAHRQALITSYFPWASRQTILLSTDSEIYGQHYDMLRPFVDTEYTLMYNDSTKHTAIEKGYFGGTAQ